MDAEIKGKRYTEQADEGFDIAEPHHIESIIQFPLTSTNSNEFKTILFSQSKSIQKRYDNARQRPVLKFLSIERQRKIQHYSSYTKKNHSIDNKQQQDQIQGKVQIKELKQEKKKQKKQNMDYFIKAMLIKSKRIEIGQNLSLRTQIPSRTRHIQCLPQIAHQQSRQPSSYAYFRKLARSGSTFLNSKYNKLLKTKIDPSSISIQSFEKKKAAKDIEFNGDYEGGNLDYVADCGQETYELYLRIDTNTVGHQSWFNFKIKNNTEQIKQVRLKICHLKRSFRMIYKGQKLHIRPHTKPASAWQFLNDTPQISLAYSSPKRLYALSFSVNLQSFQEYQIALIPTYTYSQMLKDVEQIQNHGKASVQVLTYSLTGLAIPIITITSKAEPIQQIKTISKMLTPHKEEKHQKSTKKLYLISCRIHPSETCSSFITKGFIKQLLNPEMEPFLSNAVIKIIPMLNPDGVVFGNFRTSYTGDDLNRKFNSNDQTVHPQVCALKELGKQLKNEYGQNFIAFIDMHGHSSMPNIFSYGPQHDTSSQKYLQCRIFPKLLALQCDYFKYESSSFRLQEYKQNTARGYFFKRLGIMSYTIEASYGLLNQKDSKQLKPISAEHWETFGKQMAKSIQKYTEFIKGEEKGVNKKNIVFQNVNKSMTLSNHKQESDPLLTLILKMKRQLKKQQQKDVLFDLKKQHTAKSNVQTQVSQSDGDSQDEDLPQFQKQELLRKIRQVSMPTFLFPRVLRPAIVRPSVVVPSVVQITNSQTQKQQNFNKIPKLSNIKVKRNKYHNIKSMNANSQYTQYLLKNISGLDLLKPQISNFSNLRKQKLPNQRISLLANK